MLRQLNVDDLCEARASGSDNKQKEIKMKRGMSNQMYCLLKGRAEG
jgi:hypothetical protein